MQQMAAVVLLAAGAGPALARDALARNANGPVAELMAGSGRLSVPIALDGIDITCVDTSPEMLGLRR